MSGNSNNGAKEKSETTISSDRPFLLEISPEKLEVPPEGLLEVTIKNPTPHEQELICRFDSFYFLVDFKNARWHQEGDTPSAAVGYHKLKPDETYTLTIGYDNGKYPEEVLPCYTCENEKRVVRKKDDTKKQRLDPKDNIYYNLKRPEGVLKIRYSQSDGKSVYISKKMDIYLSEETEKYRMLKEVYLKIRLDQKRRVRWGETLDTHDCVTYRYFKPQEDLREFFDSNGDSHFKSVNTSPEMFWEKVLVTRCTPKNLEEFDKVSDDEIMKIKMKRRESYIHGWLIFNVDDLQQVVEECWGDECQCEMPRLLTRQEYEKSMEPYVEPKKKSVQKVVKLEEPKVASKPKSIKESKEKFKKSLKKLPQPEKSAPSSKFDNLESVHKSSEKMKQEEVKIEEKKTPTTPEVAPIPKEKTPMVREKKNKKKKKGNPCCSVS